MIPDTKLDFWIKENYNVILRGYHGVGKTAIIRNAFERHNLNWLYFSAATMDPWVDFVGVPKERKDENGVVYLDLIRPKVFAEDKVEAIFMDEFNRSTPKVRNAVMELLQFKSINGKKFNNLKIIWCAINPEDEEENLDYDVEKIDPAQLDRFQVIYDVPYLLDKSYFYKKFGNQITNAVTSWWNELDKSIKLKISPRRVDYAMECYTKNGDLRDILPKEANIKKLLIEIENGTFEEQLKAVTKTKNENKIKEFIDNENNFLNGVMPLVIKSASYRYLLKYLNAERLAMLMTKNQSIFNYVCKNENDFVDIIKSLTKSYTNGDFVKKLRRNTTVWKPKIREYIHKQNENENEDEIDILINTYKKYSSSNTKNVNITNDYYTSLFANYFALPTQEKSKLNRKKNFFVDLVIDFNPEVMSIKNLENTLYFIDNYLLRVHIATINSFFLDDNMSIKTIIIGTLKELKKLSTSNGNADYLYKTYKKIFGSNKKFMYIFNTNKNQH